MLLKNQSWDLSFNVFISDVGVRIRSVLIKFAYHTKLGGLANAEGD